MSAPASAGHGLTLHEQVLELWFEGRFDTFTIADALRVEGQEITEAQVANIIADEKERRHAARQQGGARA
ncbi:hypothetical protein [Methylorubrum populi]|uniref:hypothetical protein n=1 Tax=Methylorubrum populi TaxID=223967 RepID=UPI001648A510|nr:hypothetical protein [Methylorubrum populi]